MLISVISPFYNSEKTVSAFVEQVKSTCDLAGFSLEIILVDDRSPDKTWEEIKKLKDLPFVRAIRLSRNFGQHAALSAGINHAKGDYLIVMDCDLQDNPVYIKELVNKAQEGFNIVCTIKNQKAHNVFRRFTSNLFFRVFNSLSDVKLEDHLGTMTLMDRKVADTFDSIKDYHRHTSLVLRWVGFKRGYVNIVHETRRYGESSYNLSKLLKHALDGIVSQSNRLLNLSVGLGLALVVFSLLFLVALVVGSAFYTYEIGWPSTIGAISLSTGLIMFTLGIHGIYIGKIFDQVKERPIYIIDEKQNL